MIIQGPIKMLHFAGEVRSQTLNMFTHVHCKKDIIGTYIYEIMIHNKRIKKRQLSNF
jgi:hypothetical protein